LGLVDKPSERHSEERSDVAISLAFNARNCFAVARNDENMIFSTGPKAGIHSSCHFSFTRRNVFIRIREAAKELSKNLA